MTIDSDNRETSSVFSGYIEEVQQLLRANQIKFGAPSDLQNLARTFKSDPRLREDLVSLTRSIMERDKTVTLRRVLTIIAVASGGPEPAISENDTSRASDLTNLITSFDEGTRTRMENHVFPDVQPTTSLSNLEAQSTQSGNAEDSEDPSILYPITASPHPPPRADVADHYAESLTRLELNSLQMKHYLDSIDQRIRRMEPRLDSLPEYVSTPAALKSGHSAEARYSSSLASENLPSQPQNQPLPPAQEVKPKEAASNLRIDSRRALASKHSAVPVVAGLATVAIVLACLFYWTFQRDRSSTSSSIMIRPATSDLTDTGTTAPSNLASPANANTSSPPKSTTGTAQQSNPAASKALPVSPGQHPSSKPTPIRRSTSSPSLDHPSTAAAAESSPPTPLTSSPASSATPEGYSDSPPMGRINVSSGVMAANILSAPQPSYPRLASLTHMQGEVVMHADISKQGNIEDVHVIKGHRLLRSAATNAVRTWRYRPFLVNGRPVEVATIVTVEFKLPR